MNNIKEKLIPLNLESEELRSKISERLHLIRKRILKITREEMASSIGISEDRLLDFESGKMKSDHSILIKVLIYLMSKNIDIRFIFLEDFSLESIRSEVEKNFKYQFNNETI